MASKKRGQDWIYLVLVVMHLQAMIAVDFVEFYPPALTSPGGLLHILTRYRDWYINTMNDPYYDIATPGHFFKFSVYIELFLQFPLALLLLYSLLGTRPLDGPAELTGAIYGTVVGLFTLLVCNDTWYMEGLDEEIKKKLFWQVYLPFGICACAMGLDMYVRAYTRLRRLEGKSKTN